jgi:O-antigen/teichoic acid export membrane protein
LKSENKELKKTFIQNLVILLGLNLLVKPFYLLIVETEIQNRTGPDDFGIYFALINFSFIINIIPDLGITNWNIRRTSQQGYPGKLNFIKLIKLRMVLAAIYVLVALIFGMFLHYSHNQLWFLLVLSFNQVMVSAILYLRSFLSGMQRFKSDSIVSVMDRLLLLILMSILLWGMPEQNEYFQIEWLIYGQTISYAATLLIAAILVLKGSARTETKKTSPIYTGEVIRESLPFAILIMLSMLGYRADSVMLERISGAGQAGIYAMAFRFFEAVNMISYLFAVLLLPMFSKLIAEKQSVAPLFQLGFKVLYSAILCVSVVSIFYNSEILHLFYESNTTEAAEVFSWLMISALFFSLQYISGTLITASGKMKPMIWIAFGGMLYNIILNMIYIPSEGALGAAKASCYTQLVIFFAQLMVVIRKFDTGNLKQIGWRTLMFTLLSITTAMIITSDIIHPSLDSFGWILLLILIMAYSFLTRMIDLSSIRSLIPNFTRSARSLTLHNEEKIKT